MYTKRVFNNFHQLDIYVKYRSCYNFCIIQPKDYKRTSEEILPVLYLQDYCKLEGVFDQNSNIQVPGISQSKIHEFLQRNEYYNIEVEIFYPKHDDTILEFIYRENNQEFIDYHYKGEIRHYTVFNPTDLDFLNHRNIEYFYVIET